MKPNASYQGTIIGILPTKGMAQDIGLQAIIDEHAINVASRLVGILHKNDEMHRFVIRRIQGNWCIIQYPPQSSYPFH